MITSIKPGTSPFIMVIFGATGDLAQNKLIPSLFSLYKEKYLPDNFYIIGFSRRRFGDDEFRGYFEVGKSDPEWKDFSSHLFYQPGSFDDEKGYDNLSGKLKEIDTKMGACVTRFFYLATPPDHYETILDNLVKTRLSDGCGADREAVARLRSGSEDKGGNEVGKKANDKNNVRVIIEKPFGKDLETARNLDKKLADIFEEQQIFRVDHYLGKETVQNMLAFRFANGIFEPVWSNKFIDHVQITWAESAGIGRRGKFFDGVGMLRDVAQNHIMQLISAVAMDQPKSFTREDLRDARAKVIASIECPREGKSVVKGQYKDYKKEENVAANSQTETFVAMKLFVNTERFKGVPFFIRAGKKMPKNLVEISVVFIQTCHILFKEYGCPEIGNVMTFRIQPDEGINLRFIAKKPGAKLDLQTVNMKFAYKEGFGTPGLDAYQRVLLDIFAGDQMLFNRSDELESSWTLITDILNKWKNEKEEIQTYAEDTWGPEEADEIIEQDGKKWLET